MLRCSLQPKSAANAREWCSVIRLHLQRAHDGDLLITPPAGSRRRKRERQEKSGGERERKRITQLIMFRNLHKRGLWWSGEETNFRPLSIRVHFPSSDFQNLWLKPIYLMSSHPLLTRYLSNCLIVLLSFLHTSRSLYLFLSLSPFISLLSYFILSFI